VPRNPGLALQLGHQFAHFGVLGGKNLIFHKQVEQVAFILAESMAVFQLDLADHGRGFGQRVANSINHILALRLEGFVFYFCEVSICKQLAVVY